MPPRDLDASPTMNISWNGLIHHAKMSRNEMRSALQQHFSKTTIVKTENGCKIFALGNNPNSSTQTLLSVDLPLSEIENFNESINNPYILSLQNVFKDESFKTAPPSAEFSLLCERQRTGLVAGITDYNIQNDEMLLLTGDQVYRYSVSNESLENLNVGREMFSLSTENEVMDIEPEDHTNGCSAESASSMPQEPKSSTSGQRKKRSANFVSDAQICPSDSNIIAYVLNKQVYIEKNGRLLYRTTSDTKHVTNGVPSYICMEELERFEGIWWSKTEQRLLYERVDESRVENAAFGINGLAPQDPMKYPRAGTTNATSTLRMIVIKDDKAVDVGLKVDLRSEFPALEYITRAGFCSDGRTVWIQAMSRQQNECVLMLIPETDFDFPFDLVSNKNIQACDTSERIYSNDCDYGTWKAENGYQITKTMPRSPLRKLVAIYRDKSPYWINVNNSIVPLKIEDESNPLYQFIYCLEKNEGSCLHLISSELDVLGYCRKSEAFPLMTLNHSLNKSIQVKVDESRKLVYYVANESHPTEWNVCVSSYENFTTKRLTDGDMSFRSERANPNLAINFDIGFVCWITSIKAPPVCRFYSLRFTKGSTLPTAVYTSQIQFGKPSVIPTELSVNLPEILEYVSPKTGFTHYAMIIRPVDFDANKKYPVFHYVYGGPGIQLVHNDFALRIQYIKYTRLGFIVVIIDNRGSANRGMEFERHILNQMGTVEVEDQVEGLNILSEMTGGIMDMSRVIVHGWSYGGYMALLMLANYPEVYRGCIAGGAVSNWKLYDTAYTERYMGYPILSHYYNESSVLRAVEKLPNEPNRLMIVHGLMDENVHFTHTCELIDECVKHGKWHELLVFPNERHGIRNSDTASYLDARMLCFIQKSLSEPVSKYDW